MAYRWREAMACAMCWCSWGVVTLAGRCSQPELLRLLYPWLLPLQLSSQSLSQLGLLLEPRLLC